MEPKHLAKVATTKDGTDHDDHDGNHDCVTMMVMMMVGHRVCDDDGDSPYGDYGGDADNADNDEEEEEVDDDDNDRDHENEHDIDDDSSCCYGR